ncbi:trypsin-like serine protease [Martelella mediterranea]|uniref:trypsin-like serine protease n=1 Tax=Martelella mediterranea TaxID=293089 RepID=UPI001045F4C1|nr:trypsin-like serine protease [Martelella mediterranea]
MNVKEGKVNSLPVKSLVAKIDFSQKLVQGMSGGPLVTHENEVAGIIHKGGPTESKDLAINVEELLKWLAEEAE